ncbi:MAG: tetratricopeptide repeat protein [Promethearchaeota archaeon]
MEKQPAETADLEDETAFLSEENKAKMEKYHQMISQNPSDVEAWINLGILLIQTRSYHKSLEHLNRALNIITSEQKEENIPKNVMLQNALAVAYIQLGEYSKAQECLEKALTFDGANKDILNNFAILYTRIGKAKEAIDYFLKILEMDDTDIHTWENLAELYRLLGEYDESLRCKMRVLELSDLKGER